MVVVKKRYPALKAVPILAAAPVIMSEV